MKRTFFTTVLRSHFLLLILFVFAIQKLEAQGYIDCATVLTDVTDFGLNTDLQAKVQDGLTYITFSAAYDSGIPPPVIGSGAPHIGSNTGYIAVFDENCNQIAGSFVDGTDEEDIFDMVVNPDGTFCVVGITNSLDFPTTDGTTPTGIVSTFSDEYIFVQKYATDGTLLFSTVQGGPTNFSGATLTKDGTDIIISGQTQGSTEYFQTTTDGTNGGGGGFLNTFVAKLDATGNLIYASMYGGIDREEAPILTTINGCTFVSGLTSSSDFPTTDGSTFSAGSRDGYILKYDAQGNVVFSQLIGGSGYDRPLKIISDGTCIYLSGETSSTDFPTTDGSVASGGNDIFIQKYDTLGNLVYAKLLGGTGNEDFKDLLITSCGLYLLTEVTDGFSTTDGTSEKAGVIKMDAATGAVDFSTTYGTADSYNPNFTVADNCELYLTMQDLNPLTTDGSSGSGITFVKLNTDGSLCAATVIPGTVDNIFSEVICMEVDGDTLRTIYNADGGSAVPEVTTDGTFSNPNDEEMVLSKFVFCPPTSPPPVDTLYPSTQMACKNGILSVINGVDIMTDGSIFPTIYTGGVPGQQPDIPLVYQWQFSTSLAGPYTDVAGPLAKLTNYSPPPTTIDIYYRRLTKTSECCGGTIVSTSDTSSVIVSTDVAPLIELPSLAVICPGVGIDYAPMITGGIAPYSFLWNTGQTDSTITVAPTEISLYGITVTDGNGCQQVAQAPVQTYSADAGPDVSVCDGDAVTIGGSPLAGVAVVPEGSPALGDYSIAYTWMPAAGLSCTDCPKPSALPSSDETYTLTVTLYQPDGTACTTADMVNVTLIAPPNVANFAGRDTVICNGEIANLGYTPEVFNTYNITAGTASSGGAITPSNFSDGNFTTGIKTDDGITENVVLDLGNVYTINQIEMAINNISQSWDSDFFIEASADNSNWVTLFTDVRTSSSATTTVPSTATTLLTFPDQMIRYFRFTSESDFRDVGISEFQARWGFNYIWGPGEFLSTNQSQATFDAGFVLDDETILLDPNPYTYTLSASVGTCNFVDQVTVVMIEARAGEDGKGPRLLGEPDRTPNVEETYTWERLDALSTADTLSAFLGATNIPQPPVSASFGGDTYFKLATTYTFNGVTGMCVDTVIVPEFCGCDIEFEKENGCPDVGLYGPTQITATLFPAAGLNSDDFDVVWSPAVGLDVYDQRTVTVLEDVDRTYTVTFTNKFDPSLICIETVRVNDPAFSLPSINLVSPITTCVNDPINLMSSPGNPALNYEWEPITGLDLTNPNDPIATVATTSTYILSVTDPSLEGGCIARDTVVVSVKGVADAGPDIYLCNNAEVTLGTPALAGYTYAWQPTDMGQYRNGTTPTDAEIDVDVSATQQYILTTTETASSCVVMDTVDIFVNSFPPEPTLSNYSYCPSTIGAIQLGFDNPDGTGMNHVPTGSFTYSWSPSGYLNDATVQNPTLSSIPTSETTFTLTLFGVGGCNSTATMTITPTVTLPATTSNRTICTDQEITIGSDLNSTAGGITYNWVADGANPAGGMLSDATSPNPTFSSSTAGTYIYTITKEDLSGCTNSKDVTITVTELDLGDLPGAAICLGETTQIGPEPQPGLSYQWSPGEGLSDSLIANPTFLGTTANTYTLVAVNGLGCIAELEIPVTVSLTPAPDVNLPDTTICDANATSLVINAQVLSAGDFAYQWSPALYLDNPNILNPTFFIPGTGIYEYTLEVIDQTTGCSAFETTTLDVRLNNLPEVTAFAIQPSCIDNIVQSDGYLQLSAVNFGDRYHWSEGSTFDDMSGASTYLSATSLSGVTYPYQFANGRTNPAGSQDYTIRVYNGSDSCFTDVVVTLNMQDCAVNCDCAEYLYLNDTQTGEIHKFLINLDSTLTEIGAPWMSGFSDPHGLGVDNNGRFYIGDASTGPIYKVDCGGGTRDVDGTLWSSLIEWDLYNIGSYEGYIIANGGNGSGLDGNEIHVFNPCDGMLVGSFCLNGFSSGDWGLQVLNDGTIIATSGAFQNGDEAIYQFQFDTTLLDGTCIDPFINTNDPLFLNGSLTVNGVTYTNENITLGLFGSIFGITKDDTYIYVLTHETSFDEAYLLKINATTGELVAVVEEITNPNSPGIGWNGALGLIYAPSSGLLYISGYEDCISIMDPSNLSYICAGAGPVLPGTNPKAVAIAKECCPTNNNLTLDTMLCTASLNTQIFLQELLNCDGSICEGVWQQGLSNTGVTYNACDNSVTINALNACGTFTLESDGTGNNPQCGAFKITVNIEVLSPPSVTLIPDSTICAGESILLYGILATGGMPTYQWQESTTSCMTGFINIMGATDSTYLATPTDTTYYRLISSSVGTCASGNCVDTSACVQVFVPDCDWGDLPDTSATTNASDYQTTSSNNGPVHQIISGLSLGNTIDGEPDGQPSTDALGDDTDEDGLMIFPSLDISPGSIFKLPLSYINTTGMDAHLEAWLDWNNNGTFDSGEMIFDAMNPSVTYIEVTAPNNAVTGEYLGLRIRISNQDDMTPYGLISSGEVEDYLIGIDCATQICIPISTTIQRQ